MLLTEVHSKKQNEEEAASWFPVGDFRPDGAVGCVPVSVSTFESFASLLYGSIYRHCLNDEQANRNVALFCVCAV